jgi:hypothetical protein
MTEVDFRHTITSIQDITKYVRGGHGKFTMQSIPTGKHLTYQVSSPKEIDLTKDRPLWISFLNYQNEFEFIGTLWEDNLVFKLGKKARVTEDAPCVAGIKWLTDHIRKSQNLPETMLFWHEGVCCRCGRPLTNPESIERGIGPFCASM